MRTVLGAEALRAPPPGSAVTIGTFDGVHVGHRALIERTVAVAHERGLASVVITWDRHPSATLRPEAVPPLVTGSGRKAELIAATGVDVLAVLAFDERLARLPPEGFVADVLVRGLGVKQVCVGQGWRFGHRASGDVALLSRLGREAGFEVHTVPLADVAGAPASSSRARAAVATADLTLARALLGRPFDLDGKVVHGAHRGRSLGYPTANLAVDAALVRPPRGVYAGAALVRDRRLPAAVNIGTNPQFSSGDSAPERVEVYLLDFEGDLYGETVRIEFHRRLRDERRFDSVADLVAQIGRDVQAARALTC